MMGACCLLRIEEHTWECGDKSSSLGADMSLEQGFWILINTNCWWKSNDYKSFKEV